MSVFFCGISHTVWALFCCQKQLFIYIVSTADGAHNCAAQELRFGSSQHDISARNCRIAQATYVHTNTRSALFMRFRNLSNIYAEIICVLNRKKCIKQEMNSGERRGKSE